MRIRQKTNLLKRMLPSLGIVLFVGVLLAPLLMTMLPATASADNSGEGKFEYSDTKASNIYELRDGTTQKYTRSTSGQGVYTGGNADGYDGCSAFMQTNSHKYDGDTKAQWYAVCLGGRQGQKTVTVAPQKNYVGKWVDHNHITVDGVTYYDKNTDNNLNFVAVNQNNGCDANVIKGFPGGDGGDVSHAGAGASLTINEPFSSTNSKCTSKTVPISFDDTQNFLRFFQWVDAGTIQTTDGTTMTFIQKNGKGPFIDNGSGSCKSTLVPDSDNQHGTLVIRYDDSNPFGSGWGKISDTDFTSKGGCKESKPIKGVNLANVDNQKKAAGTGSIDGSGSGSGDDLGLDCEGTANPLSWIICPVINDLLVPAIDQTDKLITEQMTINTDQLFCDSGGAVTDTCGAYYSAWASFRNIALGLITIVGLIIVIAQAVGMEIIDAYTIRKMLPRVLVAAVAITLSWPLMNFAITLSNNLGFGIRDLIIAPFHGLSSTINLNFSNEGGISGGITNLVGGGIGTAAVATAAVPLWIALGGLGVLLSYIGTAGLAVLVAILTLVLRQILIIMLVLVSPLAIVAYVMPNTQRMFRLWWEAFSRALLMFPMIVAMIAAGRVFAAISLENASNGAGGVFRGLIAFVAYFAPYFLIPLTFRFAGSAMGGIGNFIQQRSQGLSNGLSSFRSGQRQSRVARARQTGLYRKDLGQFKYRLPGDKLRDKDKRTGGVGKMMNTAGFYSLNADEMIPMKLGGTRAQKGLNLPGFRRGAQVLHEQIDEARREQTSKALQQINPGYKGGRLLGGLYQGAEHDYLKGLNTADRAEFDKEFGIRDKNGAITGYRAPESYKARMLASDIISRSSDGNAREAATELGAAAAGIDAFNKSPDVNYVDGKLLGMQAAAAEGRLGLDDIVKNHNTLHDAGFHDKAQHETAMLQQLATPKRTSMARGHGIEFDSKGRAINSYADPTSPKAQSATTRENTQDIGGSKAEDLHGLHGQAWVAKLSPTQMAFDPNAADHDGKHKGGTVIQTDVKKQDIELQRAQEAQAKWKNMAMYASGDVGVGVEIKRIWKEAGLPESELVFGGKRGSAPTTDAAGNPLQPPQAPAPPEPEQPEPDH